MMIWQPDLGFGIIIKKKSGGADKYRAIFFHKIKFSIPKTRPRHKGRVLNGKPRQLREL